ncbi:hypothetical protein JCM9533A_25960 [Catenuloplanes niger JCM 9533]
MRVREKIQFPGQPGLVESQTAAGLGGERAGTVRHVQHDRRVRSALQKIENRRGYVAGDHVETLSDPTPGWNGTSLLGRLRGCGPRE